MVIHTISDDSSPLANAMPNPKRVLFNTKFKQFPQNLYSFHSLSHVFSPNFTIKIQILYTYKTKILSLKKPTNHLSEIKVYLCFDLTLMNFILCFSDPNTRFLQTLSIPQEQLSLFYA